MCKREEHSLSFTLQDKNSNSYQIFSVHIKTIDISQKSPVMLVMKYLEIVDLLTERERKSISLFAVNPSVLSETPGQLGEVSVSRGGNC